MLLLCLENSVMLFMRTIIKRRIIKKSSETPGITNIFILFLLPFKHFLEKGTNWLRNFIFFLYFCSMKEWGRGHSLSIGCPGSQSTGYRFILPRGFSQGHRKNDSLSASNTPVVLKKSTLGHGSSWVTSHFMNDCDKLLLLYFQRDGAYFTH